MLSVAAFVCFVVAPVCAVAGILSRVLEEAARRSERAELIADMTSNTADIAGRLDNLESVLRLDRREIGEEAVR